MPSPGSEICNAQAGRLPQVANFFPDFGHGARVKDLQFKAPHLGQNCATSQFHQDRERRDFPHHDFGPSAFKCQLVLIIDPFQMVFGQLQIFEPFHEIRAEHLPFSVEGIAAQPSAFAACQ